MPGPAQAIWKGCGRMSSEATLREVIARLGTAIETLEGAVVARNPAAEEQLERVGKQSFARNEVVDVDLIDVEVTSAGIRPIRLRERIRAAGPTNRLDLGKQAHVHAN